MAVIGVDPGKIGAIVYVPNKGIPKFWRIPMKRDGKLSSYDIEGICKIFEDLPQGNDLMAIEGTTRPASLVRCRAIFETIGVMLGIDTVVVHPAKWKRDLGLGRDKQDSMDLASTIFPTIAPALIRVTKDDGIAEAALIAHWAMENEYAR